MQARQRTMLLTKSLNRTRDAFLTKGRKLLMYRTLFSDPFVTFP
jgi:hypothetical protein